MPTRISLLFWGQLQVDVTKEWLQVASSIMYPFSSYLYFLLCFFFEEKMELGVQIGQLGIQIFLYELLLLTSKVFPEYLQSFSDFPIFYQVFLSIKVKRWAIIT